MKGRLSAARTAISISKRFEQLRRAQGKAHNSDFLEDIKQVKLCECSCHDMALQRMPRSSMAQHWRELRLEAFNKQTVRSDAMSVFHGYQCRVKRSEA